MVRRVHIRASLQKAACHADAAADNGLPQRGLANLIGRVQIRTGCYQHLYDVEMLLGAVTIAEANERCAASVVSDLQVSARVDESASVLCTLDGVQRRTDGVHQIHIRAAAQQQAHLVYGEGVGV